MTYFYRRVCILSQVCNLGEVRIIPKQSTFTVVVPDLVTKNKTFSFLLYWSRSSNISRICEQQIHHFEREMGECL